MGTPSEPILITDSDDDSQVLKREDRRVKKFVFSPGEDSDDCPLPDLYDGNGELDSTGYKKTRANTFIFSDRPLMK